MLDNHTRILLHATAGIECRILRHLEQMEIRMSARSDALSAAVTAEMAAITVAVNAHAADMKDLQDKLAAALAFASGADPDLAAAVDAALPVLNASVKTLQDGVPAPVAPPVVPVVAPPADGTAPAPVAPVAPPAA